MELFITCQKGLESYLTSELTDLGFDQITQKYCGVSLETNEEGIYLINYLSRLAGRVLQPLLTFKCLNKEDLYKKIREIEWAPYFSDRSTFSVDANVSHKDLRNSHFAALIVKDAICDQLRDLRGARPDVSLINPDIQLNLFIFGNQAIISFDTSGAPLYKRGYRTEQVEAPIQESVASAVLQIAQYKKDLILLDPCCGSGTFLIEAAMLATNTPAGFYRKDFGFFRAPFFKKEKWNLVKEQADSKRIPLEKNKIIGIEINKNNARIARTHVKNAGFSKEIEVICGDFRQIELNSSPNLIATNPPFGKRLGEEKTLIELYKSLGDLMKQKTIKPAKGYIYCANDFLSRQVGLRPSKREHFKSSGMEATVVGFELY